MIILKYDPTLLVGLRCEGEDIKIAGFADDDRTAGQAVKMNDPFLFGKFRVLCSIHKIHHCLVIWNDRYRSL